MNSFNFDLYDDEEDYTYTPVQKPKQDSQEKKPDFDFDLYDDTPEPKEEVKKKEYGFLDTAKDVAKQGTKGVLIGALGTYGDLTELAGINRENPTDTAKNARDFDTLDKLNDSGKKRGFWETYALVNDLADDSPTSLRLPTSKNIESLNDAIGGPGEAETPSGEASGRAGRNFGAGLAFGQVNPAAAVVSGGAGQIVKELGGGELAQTAAEISALLLTPGQGVKSLVGSAKKEVQEKINKLRKLGYTEEDITLAINSASKGSKGGVKARKSAKTENAFEEFAERSDDLVSKIFSQEVPGIDKGTKYVHELASDAYGQVAKQGSNLIIRDSTPFINSATNVVKELRKNLGKNPEAEGFLNRLHDAVIASTKKPSAESFMNFYKELNSMGNWLGRSRKDALISQVKNGIKETFRSEGKQGIKLAEDFEKVNLGVKKAFQAEEAFNLVQKTATQDGIDYKKLNKLFDKPDNIKILEDALGKTQTQNLKLISKVGREVKDFDKAWKATHLLQGNTIVDIARVGGASYYLYKGDMDGLLTIAATKSAGIGAKKIAEKFLTDPKFQNLWIKGLHALKNNSTKNFGAAVNDMQSYFDKEGIDIQLNPKKDQGK
jgi:hypothetical protein